MSTDATQVTGSSASEDAPRPGDVLAERYELLEAVDTNGPAVSYRALDQESERPVLVRVVPREGLPQPKVNVAVSRLRGLVGVGGRYLGSLLDADQENGAPFTVEAWPRGTQLSAILDARRGRGEALGPQETLPVVAQLAAALEALPEPLCHGDLRAERVWLDTDGLRLTGAHLLAALGPDIVAQRIEALGPGAMAYAPEMKAGRLDDASDRWGVASIAWEALTGRSPDPDADSPEITGALRDALAAGLSEDPTKRPPLEDLVKVLAGEAGLSVPRLDPEAFQPPTAVMPKRAPVPRPAPRPRKIAGAAAEGTQEISFDQIIEEEAGPPTQPKAGLPGPKPREPSVDSLDPRLVRAALGVSLDSEDDEELPSADDTAKHDAVSVEEAMLAEAGGPDSLDPRLVRAALDVQMDSDADSAEIPADDKPKLKPGEKPREPSIDGLDPRLVRAALGVTLDDSIESGLEELDSSVLELEEDVAPRVVADRPPSAKAKPAASPRAAAPKPKPRPKAGPPKAALPRPSRGLPPKAGPPKGVKARPRPTPKTKPPKPAPPKAAPPKAAAPKPAAPKPAAPKPSAPKPSAPKAAPPVAATPQPAPSAPAPQPAPPAAQPVAVAPTPAPPASAAPASRPGHARPIQAPPEETTSPGVSPTPKPKRSSASRSSSSVTGIIIVMVALIVAAVIIGVGFLIASHRRSEAAHQRELDQRWEQIQQQRETPD